MKKIPKYSTGGVLKGLAPFASFIPSVGPILSSALGVVGNLIESDEANKVPQTPIKVQYTKNPYATMRDGGQPNGFKQYAAPSHENGGQPIDESGNVNFNKPSAEIETIENKYTYSALPNKEGKTYVFSEQNGTSQAMADIIKKYKNKSVDKDFLTRTAMELEVNKLEKVNDLIKKQTQQQEQTQMAGGGGLNVSTRRHEQYHQDLTNHFDKVLAASQENLEQLPDGGDPEINLGVDMGYNKSIPYLQQKPLTQIPITRNLPTPNVNITNPQTTTNQNNFALPRFNPGVASDLLTAGLTAFDVLRAGNAKADAVDPRLVDYNKADEKMYSVNTDMTEIKNQALGANNQAVENVNEGTTSQAQRQARLSGVYSNFGNTLANIALQEQQQKNNFSVQQGQYEANKAQDKSNRLATADEKFAMNQAATRQLTDVARQTVNSFAKDWAAKDYARQQTAHVFEQAKLKTADSFAILNKMVSDFKLDGAAEWQKYLSNPSDENLKALENVVKIKMK